MTSTLNLSLTDELRAFIDRNCGDGTLYATPSEFVRDLLRRKSCKWKRRRRGTPILAGYQDAIAGRRLRSRATFANCSRRAICVAPKRFGGAELLLTDRALSDLRGIERYSVENWGSKGADKYLSDIEAALLRVLESPVLLREHADLPAILKFYRVSKHWLACDVRPEAIVVLTVIHGSMDLPSRLAELQPTLPAEAKLLQAKLQQRQRSRHWQ